MFRLPAFSRFAILFSVIAFVACSVAPANAQSTGSASQTKAATKQKQTKSGYVSTQGRMNCKMGGNCQK
jgi:hypothetical protein